MLINFYALTFNTSTSSNFVVSGNSLNKLEQFNCEQADTGGCDPALWDHVYTPERLKVLDNCKIVTGVIEEIGVSNDGDTHMLLKLDKGQEDLLNARNMKKKKGNLVIEVICANKATKKAAKKSCEGYLNNIEIPKTGDYVRVTGSYVIDTNNGWAEIHPVTRIEVLK